MRHTTLLVLSFAFVALTGCPADSVDTTSIADARVLAAESEATVEGYVTVAPGTFNSAIGDQGFAIQDDSAGIYVSVPDVLDLGIGDHVRVSGRLTQVAMFTTLVADPADVEVVGGSETIAPQQVTTGGVDETNEGLLVEVSGALTQAVQDDSPYGFKVFIDDGSGEVQVFVHIVDGAPVVPLEGLDVGVTITAVGLAAQYETTYEVTPRMASDLTIAP